MESQYCAENGRKHRPFWCRRIEAAETREAANESGRLEVASFLPPTEFEASRIWVSATTSGSDSRRASYAHPGSMMHLLPPLWLVFNA